METSKKDRYQLRLFLFTNNVDLENNNRNYKNHSEFSECRNSCNEFVSCRSS